MNMPFLRRATRNISAALILAGFLGLGVQAAIGQQTEQTPAKPAPAPAKPAKPSKPAATPAGNAGGGQARPSGNGAPANHPAQTPPPSANTPYNRPTQTPSPNANSPYGNRPTPQAPNANSPYGNRPVQTPQNPNANAPYGNRPTPGFRGTAGGNSNVRPAGPGSVPNSRPTVFQNPAPRGGREIQGANGSAIRMRPNGKPSDVHDVRRGMDIHIGLNGSRRIAVERPDHSSIVFEKGRPGYVEHPYNFRGHDFARRTYVFQGRSYDRFYHGFSYRGAHLDVYAPSFYFGRAYYGWAYNPWSVSVHYRWGWTGNPWARYYDYYFSPYPQYSSAAYWLTDYMISTDLQAAYAAQQSAGEVDGAPYGGGGSQGLTPDVKQMIADEVRNQLALENQEAQENAQQQDVDPASSGIARMLSDGRPHVFVAGAALDVVDTQQMECSLSDGDVLALSNVPAADAMGVNLTVLASKGGPECQKGDTVSVALPDLQEMQNHMRESIDQGLQELQANQGKGGLPMAPVAAQTQPALYSSVAPPPDPSAGAEIQQQAQQADQAQSEVAADTSQQSGGPATVTLGQSISDVESILGQPASKAILGSKVVYNYNGMKVIFQNGQVADVQ